MNKQNDRLIFQIPNQTNYKIEGPEKIRTPRLLVFQDRVEKNLHRIKNYLEEVVPHSGYKHLCSHIKTIKSSFILQTMINVGITSFKSTLNEVKVLAESGAKDIFIAYPLLELDVVFVSGLIQKYPETEFHIQISSKDHFNILNNISKEINVKWKYFIDIDVGMHRTGIVAEKAFDLFSEINKSNKFHFSGLHGYDGHNHHKDNALRQSTAQKSMSTLINVFHKFRDNQIAVPRIVVAGSPTFRLDLEILIKAIGAYTLVQVSPGTWVYWDSKYDSILPGEFDFAALILSQVIEVGNHQITLNLGHKRWAADQGLIEFFSEPDLKVISFNEEHTVLETAINKKYHIGDYILIVPLHVCPTVNLFENYSLINENGEIENLSVPVDARNR